MMGPSHTDFQYDKLELKSETIDLKDQEGIILFP